MQELERQLLEDPFDTEARQRYAALLCVEGNHAASAKQWQLVSKQKPTQAAPLLELAYCLTRSGDASAGRAQLDAARQCPDFDANHPRVAELAADEIRAREATAREGTAHEAAEPETDPSARLRLVRSTGTAPPALADVISISRSSTVRFADVIGMDALKKLLRVRIVEPFLSPGLFARFKKNSGGGALLYGPPGCGKTMIARAIATECDASFTPVGISDVLTKWYGESERNLAALFDKARQESPAVLFFDELDALAFSRSKASSDHTRTLVNEFLAQLDGMAGRNDKVLILAATNMPWDVDDAMKRPGRFDRQVFVPPPDVAARAEMLRAKLRDVPTASIDYDGIAARCAHFSGADLDGLIEAAKENAIYSILSGTEERTLTADDLLVALEQTNPSTLEWLKTARNLVKFGGAGKTYKDVETYLRSAKLY
jgi:SpoVK/Ycf46/Vps4 family AAA+-type ATPase